MEQTEQEFWIEILIDKVKNPRKYDHVSGPPGLYECIKQLRELGITKRLSKSEYVLKVYERVEQENPITLATNFIYKPKTIL